MAEDPLARLADLPGVSEALAEARSAVDTLLWDRSLRPRQAEVAAESALRGAWASAWFDGAEAGLAQVRTGAALDGSPIGRALSGIVALHVELPSLVGVVGTAPAQALARMHAIVARGFVPDEALGRPRTDVPDDPLRLGPAVPPDEVAGRLAGLGRLLVESSAPGVLVAAVAHAEVAVLRPFAWGSGPVARAMIRLVLAQRGVDPGMLGAPEVGLRGMGRPTYVRALRAYASGEPEGVAMLIGHVSAAIAEGARQPSTWFAGT